MSRGHVEDLTCQKFGKLTAFYHMGGVKQSTKTDFKPALWLCYCECGYPVAKTSDQLKKGKAIKCYSCKGRIKVHGGAKCALVKTLNGVKTYYEQCSRMFSHNYDCLPCTKAKEVKQELELDLLPGEFEIKRAQK